LLKGLFSGITVTSWRDTIKKALVGGIESVKASLKTKLIAAGVAVLLVFGGTTILIWHYQQSQRGIILTNQTFIANQITKGNSSESLKNSSYNEKSASSKQPNRQEEKRKAQNLGATANVNSLKEDNKQNSSQSESIVMGAETDSDGQRNKQDEKAKLEYEQEVESVKQQITELIVKYGEIVKGQERYWSMSDSERRKMDPNIADNYTDARRETGQAIMISMMNYFRLTGDHSASYPGGWIYEFGKKNSFEIRTSSNP